MKKIALLATIFALLFALSSQQTFYAARALSRVGTVNRLTRNYGSPTGVTMFTDVAIFSEQSMFIAIDNDQRNIISRIGNARVREWNSDIEHIFRAPELELRVQHNVSAGTEFSIRLHNLEWFFRSVIDNQTPSIFIDDNYSGGIDQLLPSSYNRLMGTFVPSGFGTGGTYTRIITEHSRELPFELIVSDHDSGYAIVRILSSGRFGDVIRIPIVARTTNYVRGASVEVIATSDSMITSGLYTVMSAVAVIPQDIRRNDTHTSATIHTTGIDQIRIPEIVIQENTHGIIENGSIRLEAPEGFIIVPDIDRESLGNITWRTPHLLNQDGTPVINVTLGGGLSWSNLTVRPGHYQTEGALGQDFRLRYSNPAGNLNPSILTIDINNLVASRFREPGYVVITGLRLLAVGDIVPGAQFIEITPFNNMEYLTSQSFHVGTIVR